MFERDLGVKHLVETDDGCDIALWHYPPLSDRKGKPVFLVHGLFANHNNLALDNKHGVAQYLNRNGYDCWAIDLRGRGASSRPWWPWCFDDYAQYDIPAAIQYIKNVTEYEQVNWIGHSMGGMLFYVVAGTLNYNSVINSAVTIGSPFGMQEPLAVNNIARKINRTIRALAKKPGLKKVAENKNSIIELADAIPFPLHALPQKTVAQIIGYIGYHVINYLPHDITLTFTTTENSSFILKKALQKVSTRVSYRELVQFADWVINDRWTNANHDIDYAAEVSNIETPVLVIAGGQDRLTPPYHIKWGYKKINTEDKKFLLAAKDTGFSSNYAHIDLVFGERAPDEIFPQILDWIDNHEG